MSPEERQQLIAELEIITGWSPVYIKSLTDEQLKKLHREKVRL
jgi:hypothetical protein